MAMQVLRNKGVYESVKYIQQENFWIGPSSVKAVLPFLRMLSQEDEIPSLRMRLFALFKVLLDIHFLVLPVNIPVSMCYLSLFPSVSLILFAMPKKLYQSIKLSMSPWPPVGYGGGYSC